MVAAIPGAVGSRLFLLLDDRVGNAAWTRRLNDRYPTITVPHNGQPLAEMTWPASATARCEV
jgi:hypothetical protein